jgi:putative Holliday junction resolvase
MRWLGVDVGARRIGLAVSDDTGTLARPWQTIGSGRTPAESAEAIVRTMRLPNADDGRDGIAVGGVVVGLPRRLNGDDTDQSQPARDVAGALHALLGVPVHLQDERLTSREAESRLAVRERDWRRRKQKLDAAAAAIILQDYRLSAFSGCCCCWLSPAAA